MSQELIYTSAPRGLKPGSQGFCTVAYSRGMSANLMQQLESLSGYRQILSATGPQGGAESGGIFASGAYRGWPALPCAFPNLRCRARLQPANKQVRPPRRARRRRSSGGGAGLALGQRWVHAGQVGGRALHLAHRPRHPAGRVSTAAYAALGSNLLAMRVGEACWRKRLPEPTSSSGRVDLSAGDRHAGIVGRGFGLVAGGTPLACVIQHLFHQACRQGSVANGVALSMERRKRPPLGRRRKACWFSISAAPWVGPREEPTSKRPEREKDLR